MGGVINNHNGIRRNKMAKIKMNVTSEGVTFSKGKGKFTVKREDEGIPKVGLEAFNDLAESHEAHVHQVKKLEEDLLGIIQWVQDTCSEMDLQTKTNEEILKEYYADSRD